MNLGRHFDKIKNVLRRYLKFNGIILLFILLLPSVSWLFGPGYFNMHDDLQVMRIYEMVRCFDDGQIPCRWSPDMTNGYGQAMFNFYSVFPYYLGIFYKLIFSASYLGTVKFLFIVSLVAGGVGMFLLARKLWGFWGGIVSAVLYTYAPYHAVDVYVRGALAESFALAILPFVWLFSYNIVIKRTKYDIVLFSLSLFALFTTHNISMLIYAPFTVLWVLFWIIYQKNYKAVLPLAIGGVLGFGMASFFIVPAIIEQNLINIEQMTSVYYSYVAHFADLNQLFISRFWGDGGSTFGPNDGMSFAIGWPHWWNLIYVLPLALIWFRTYEKRKESFLLIMFTVFFFFTAFLVHSKSIFIWQPLKIMNFIQFPWRFLGLSIFFISLAGGALGGMKFIPKYLLGIVVIFLTLYFNISYFTPVNYSRLVTDEAKLFGLAWVLQQKGGASDYLPKGVRVTPEFTAPPGPKIISGNGEISDYRAKSNGFSLSANLSEDSELVFPYIYFPNWKASINGTTIPVETDGAHDVIKLSLPKGNYQIVANFYNTPVRSIANMISLITSICVIALILRLRRSSEEV